MSRALTSQPHRLASKAGAPALLLAAGLVLSACAGGLGSDDYSRSGVGQLNRTDTGTVLSVRDVRIEGTKSGVGTGAGAIAGAAGGASIGQGDAAEIAGAVGGAVLGGLIGAAAEEGLTRQRGTEYVIQRANGSVVTVVQGADAQPIAPGTPVIILFGDRVRVIPDSSGAAAAAAF